MPKIDSVQHGDAAGDARAGPYTPYIQRDLYDVVCSEFHVTWEKAWDPAPLRLALFLPNSKAKSEEVGVGLRFHSKESAIAVARALLSVAEGHLTECHGTFGPEVK